MSGKTVHVGGAYAEMGEVMASHGGQQARLDATVLACEMRVREAVQKYSKAITGMYG